MARSPFASAVGTSRTAKKKFGRCPGSRARAGASRIGRRRARSTIDKDCGEPGCADRRLRGREGGGRGGAGLSRSRSRRHRAVARMRPGRRIGRLSPDAVEAGVCSSGRTMTSPAGNMRGKSRRSSRISIARFRRSTPRRSSQQLDVAEADADGFDAADALDVVERIPTHCANLAASHRQAIRSGAGLSCRFRPTRWMLAA